MHLKCDLIYNVWCPALDLMGTYVCSWVPSPAVLQGSPTGKEAKSVLSLGIPSQGRLVASPSLLAFGFYPRREV